MTKMLWKSAVVNLAHELQNESPSLAGLILCTDVLTEDEQKVTLMVGNKFNQKMLSSDRATQKLLSAAAKVGLEPKTLQFLTMEECEQKIPQKEEIIHEVWENLT